MVWTKALPQIAIQEGTSLFLRSRKRYIIFAFKKTLPHLCVQEDATSFSLSKAHYVDFGLKRCYVNCCSFLSEIKLATSLTVEIK